MLRIRLELKTNQLVIGEIQPDYSGKIIIIKQKFKSSEPKREGKINQTFILRKIKGK